MKDYEMELLAQAERRTDTYQMRDVYGATTDEQKLLLYQRRKEMEANTDFMRGHAQAGNPWRNVLRYQQWKAQSEPAAGQHKT